MEFIKPMELIKSCNEEMLEASLRQAEQLLEDGYIEQGQSVVVNLTFDADLWTAVGKKVWMTINQAGWEVSQPSETNGDMLFSVSFPE